MKKKEALDSTGSHLNDGAEPAGVSHIADADRPVVLSDPVCWAAHLCLDFTSLPLHPRCVLLSTDLQAPGAQWAAVSKKMYWHVVSSFTTMFSADWMRVVWCKLTYNEPTNHTTAGSTSRGVFFFLPVELSFLLLGIVWLLQAELYRCL